MAILLAVSPMVSAQAPAVCDDIFAPQLSAQQQLQRGLALEAQCLRHSAYLYQLGRLLNQAGRYAEAVDRLESALLHDPDHWPSQMEYAVALAGVGDSASAHALLHMLAARPGLPANARQQLAAMQQQAAAQPVPNQPSATRLMLAVSGGYDDNLLGSAANTQLDLTLAGTRLTVQTDPDQLPHAGAFLRADLRLDGQLGAGANATWRYSLLASQRHSPSYSPANLGQWGVLLERSGNNQHGPYGTFIHQLQQQNGALVLQQTQLGLGLDAALRVAGHFCNQRLGLELQQLHYPSSPSLDGRYKGIVGQLDCPSFGLQLQLQLGQDQPHSTSRPGGTQRQQRLRLGKITPVGTAKISLALDLLRQADQTGYSTLLENNAPRTNLRRNARLEYQWQPHGRVAPYVSFEVLQQQSNLPLFQLQNKVLTLGLRSTW